MMPGGHVTADWIAAYLDGGLTREERERLERHLLVCADCRKDLADASELTPRETRRWLVGGGVSAALAAAAVLMLWLGANDAGSRLDRSPVLRGSATDVQVEAVTPSEGADVAADSLVFTWRSAGATASYVFTLTDEDGDVLYTASQSDTTLVLPRSVGLAPAGQYYWVVDALLDGARSATSGFQGFRVE